MILGQSRPEPSACPQRGVGCQTGALGIDHSTWGVTALSTVLPLRDVAVLVTDGGLPGEARGVMRARVRELVLTPVGV